ncbi:MAG: membrane protein insertase YidC [Firmicutes bacterium]|nr:membrane protein insertase YidC [Bacillota bacterium]MCM1400731.1 membrane protein insertase YidC [Bacteroides sp.]MCM1476850.1 membrane protein insertase YidC [Bacteroides sp.]
MNKTNLTGMLLMAAVIVLFMYFNQPSAEERAAMAEKARQEQLQAEQTDNNPQAVLSDTIVTPQERSIIASTISEFGSKDSTGLFTLQAPGVKLTMAADSTIGGDVTLSGGTKVAMKNILEASYGSLPRAKAAEACRVLRKAMSDVARYKGFAAHLGGDSTTVRLENDNLALDISNKGAVIARAAVKGYQRYDSTEVAPIEPFTDGYSFILTSASQRFDTRDFFFTVSEKTDSAVTMTMALGDGASWGIRYTLPKEGYLVGMEIVQQGMENVIPASVTTMEFVWNQTMARNEEGRMFEEQNSALYYMNVGGDVENLSETSDDTEEVTQRVKWIGYKNQFFSTIMVPRGNFTGANFASVPLKDDPRYLKQLSTSAEMDYSSGQASPAAFTIFIGPNSYPLLSDLEDTVAPEENLHFTKLIPLGWSLFRWINTLIVIPVFTFLGQFISSYGIIILILTLFIKLILFPFTYKSYMSQAKMRVLAPEIKEINDRFPGQENAMKRQQESMALYSRAGASPMSGCLPLLLQMPILIAMFKFFPSAIELRGQSFLWVADLSAPDYIISLPFAIPFLGNKLSLFCLLMTVTNIIYTRINMQNQPGGNSMPGMKWMMYLMPVMFLFFFNNYAAGLSYYYFLSLLITIIQTYIFRQVVNEDKVRATMRENAKKPKKKSGFMARLEEAQRKQQAMLREQEKQRNRRQHR